MLPKPKTALIFFLITLNDFSQSKVNSLNLSSLVQTYQRPSALIYIRTKHNTVSKLKNGPLSFHDPHFKYQNYPIFECENR